MIRRWWTKHGVCGNYASQLRSGRDRFLKLQNRLLETDTLGDTIIPATLSSFVPALRYSNHFMDANIFSNPEHGFRLNFSAAPSEIQHPFCGSNEIEGATCSACLKPLLRILSLATADPGLNVSPNETPAIHLLYCWTCSIPFGIFSYRILKSSTVEILEVPPAYEYAFGPEGPYEGYTGNFPQKNVSLVPLSDDEEQRQRAAQADDDLALELGVQSHQIGGFPLIANPQQVSCPVCSKPSPLFAVIADEAVGNPSADLPHAPQDTFTGNAGTQMVFHLCRTCSVVSAYHSND